MPSNAKKRQDNAPDEGRRLIITWLWRLPVVVTLVGGGYAVLRAAQVHFGKDEPTKQPTFEPLERIRVAALMAFPDVWSGVAFTAGTTPAIAIRLPEPVPGGITVGNAYYAAYSRVCTHQGCVVNWSTSLEAIALATNYRPETPALVCPCHLSVFLASDAGKAVSGPAVRPLPRFQLNVHRGVLYAVGVEHGAA